MSALKPTPATAGSGGPSGSGGDARSERIYAAYARPAWQRWLFTRETAVIALLVGVLVWANVEVPNFDGPLTLYYLFLDLMPILLIALPMTLIIITGEIDLSVASTVVLTSAMTGVLCIDLGWSFGAAALAAIALGAVAGAFNGFLVGYVGLPSLAVTIGTLALYRGIAVGLLGTEAKTGFPDEWTDRVKERIGESSYPQVLIVFGVLAVLFVLLLHFSSFGRGVYEIGLNDEAARFSGVDVARTKLLLFVLAGAVSGLAGVYYTLRYDLARGDSASGLELQVIAAVLLGGVSIFGGRGALHGVVAGVLLIGVITSAMRLQGETENVTTIVIGLLLVASVVTPSLLAWASGRLPSRGRGKSGPGRSDPA
ncbi:ABC transporter permease [Nocardioides zeae]|uniref:Autoinducer 2 import system permease protein LsrD n=1 Tax=Nocardioides imazamoxiresistens TaxID=3231893 RepID=A0ABU3PVZ3_9ACTN|nr:ABC transporter permease [Nocardioides zeae]MDT9593409.1 ABC transporter permease [Nocardioides zeae]